MVASQLTHKMALPATAICTDTFTMMLHNDVVEEVAQSATLPSALMPRQLVLTKQLFILIRFDKPAGQPIFDEQVQMVG